MADHADAGRLRSGEHVETEQPVLALSPSRDGERVIFVTGREAGKGRTEYRVWLRGLALGAEPVPLKLRPDEQFPTATF